MANILCQISQKVFCFFDLDYKLDRVFLKYSMANIFLSTLSLNSLRHQHLHKTICLRGNIQSENSFPVNLCLLASCYYIFHYFAKVLRKFYKRTISGLGLETFFECLYPCMSTTWIKVKPSVTFITCLLDCFRHQ